MNNKEDFLSPKEAAGYLDVSISYLARMRHEDKGPTYIKRGKYVYYTRDHLNDYIRTNTTIIVPNQTKNINHSRWFNKWIETKLDGETKGETK